MQRHAVFALAAAVSLAACSPKSAQHTYDVHGQVVAVTPDRQEAIVKHGEIAGLMPAMTMPYKIKEKAELNAVKPGDLAGLAQAVQGLTKTLESGGGGGLVPGLTTPTTVG